ncbi:MAG: hypothetical protein ABSG41_17015 [Bryobacteraceae bacterium]|jgi:hypothetical protein
MNFVGKQSDEGELNFDDSNDNQSRGGRAREHSTGARAGNFDSAERCSMALNGCLCTVFDDRCRIIVDSLEFRGLTTADGSSAKAPGLAAAGIVSGMNSD